MSFVPSCLALFVLAQTAWAQYTLEEQNLQQDYLNPANHVESEDPAKDQDKRTVFPSTINNYGWAKHVAVNPSGAKYVLGYSPVDLKYVPVVRPISRPTLQLRPTKPKWTVRPVVLKPLKPQQGGWKPIYGPPAPPAQKPELEGGTDTFLQLPVKPAVPFAPARPIVPVQPVVPVAPRPVVPVVPVAPRPVVPVVPVAPRPVVPLQPVVPAAPFPPPVPPGSNLLFHVTRPNLPVLPLGATFPSPVLTSAAVRPFAPSPVIPGYSSVEFHGNHHLLRPAPLVPVGPAPAPAIPAAPAPVFPAAPAPVFPAAPGPAFPAAPVFPAAPPYLPNGFARFNPHLQVPFQGELPRQTPNVGLEQHDVQIPQTHQHIYQQNFEGQHFQEVQQQQQLQEIHQQQQLQEIQQQQQLQEFQQQQQQFQGIQPGQTDLQFPVHLPTHPHFRPVDLPSFQQSDFQTPFRTSANIVRPSIGLEPPYRRRDDVSDGKRDEGEVYEDDDEEERGLNKHK